MQYYIINIFQTNDLADFFEANIEQLPSEKKTIPGFVNLKSGSVEKKILYIPGKVKPLSHYRQPYFIQAAMWNCHSFTAFRQRPSKFTSIHLKRTQKILTLPR